MPTFRGGGVNAIKVVTTSRAESGGTLRSLTDTNVSSLANGYILVYNSTTEAWTSQSTLADTFDVDGGSF
jgi:hypothetical protein